MNEELIQTKPCRYGKMSFFKNDNTVSRSLCEYGEWAQAEIDFLNCLIDEGCTVLDVGAFIGTHAIAFARRVGANGCVYAFEPQPAFFELLKRNVEQNSLTNVHLFNVAVSAVTGRFGIPDADVSEAGNFGGTGLLESCSSTCYLGSCRSIDVITVDQLGLTRCDLIKIDAENMESNVLAGAEEVLRNSRPIVFAECSSLQYGWPVVQITQNLKYHTYLLNVPAYNPSNFRGSRQNFFGASREAGFVLLPEERLAAAQKHRKFLDCEYLIPIRCIDDLALALLKKPQYKYEVLVKSAAAAVVGSEFWANEAEVEQFRDVIRLGEDRLAETNETLAHAKEELARRSNELSQSQYEPRPVADELSMLRNDFELTSKELCRKEAALARIYSSRAWKVLSGYHALRGRLNSSRLIQEIRLIRDIRLLRNSGLFDSSWYLQQNPDVAKAGINPLRHFLRHGWTEGRDPNPIFHTNFYLMQHPDVATAAVNPLMHYLRFGAAEGRDPSPRFDTSSYLGKNPDVAQSGLNPLAHYIQYGLAEGRDPYGPKSDTSAKNRHLDVPTLSRGSLNAQAKKAATQIWEDYSTLSGQISSDRRSKIGNLSLEKPDLVALSARDLARHAASLRLPCAEPVEVSIVIPVFNHFNVTLECLTSIQSHTKGIAYEIIVVDDGSSDATPDVLPTIANLRYFRNDQNSGFIASTNRGASVANGQYILFLHNNAQVTEGWLKPLLETCTTYDQAGAVGPKIVYPDGRLQEAGVSVDRSCSSHMIGLFDDPRLPRYNYIREVMYCSSICLLIKKHTFLAVGGFDAAFKPAYCQDCDLSFVLRRKGLRVIYDPRSVVIHHLGKSASPAAKTTSIIRNRQKLLERWQSEIDKLNATKLIAFYLPQYHPIPENDRWWGKGFTEWTNVTKALPNYVGHYQPHLPADLGFYDLRIDEIRTQQAGLASRYGIYGFCYYYYWFAGKRLLHLPLERLLEMNKSEFPFCMAWANENWTRRWDGREKEVLIAQSHSDDDDRSVIQDLMRYMRNPTYIRINGRPLLIVYRINLLPDIHRTVAIWREMCRGEGIGEIYLAFTESFECAGKPPEPRTLGFDASVEFPPHGIAAPIPPPGVISNPKYAGTIHDYRQVVRNYLKQELPGHVRFRTVMPCWDNTPRRQNDPLLLENASPGAYQAWLEAVMDLTHEQNFGEERIVFINAWNEWGEGNHLEPDRRNGHAYLEATLNAAQASLLNRAGDR